MLTRSFLTPVLCSALLTLAACDKEESLGEVESETAAESESAGESDSASGSESDSGDTEGDSDSGVNCPTDAMICPDGTAVGRSGPDCEFDPCPDAPDTDSGTEGDPPPDACPPDLSYFEPAACPSKDEGTPYVIDPGCYVDCDPGEPVCGEAEVCLTLEVNPCICDEGEACCAACSAGSALCVPVSTGEGCEGVAGTSFESVEQYECGISKKGKVLCNWSIDLSFEGDYLWSYSDVGEGGEYACKDGTITLSNNPTLSASFDVATDTLTWDGIEYQPAAG